MDPLGCFTTDDLTLLYRAAVLAGAPVVTGRGCGRTIDAREVGVTDEISRAMRFITA